MENFKLVLGNKTVELTDNEIDCIYDALNELSCMSEELADTCNDIQSKLFDLTKETV
jgi:hypothetical protein